MNDCSLLIDVDYSMSFAVSYNFVSLSLFNISKILQISSTVSFWAFPVPSWVGKAMRQAKVAVEDSSGILGNDLWFVVWATACL